VAEETFPRLKTNLSENPNDRGCSAISRVWFMHLRCPCRRPRFGLCWTKTPKQSIMLLWFYHSMTALQFPSIGLGRSNHPKESEERLAETSSL
jgi:hypothetical protein